jgi:flagellar basal-body rod modification protein FlgD
MSTIQTYGQSAEDIRGTYLNLLVTQLRNQNPLNPMDSDQMSSQLAQLSELEQLEAMNSKFDRMLMAAELSQARNLIGTDVLFTPAGEDSPVQARVNGAGVVDGEVCLNAGQYILTLDEIQGIGETGERSVMATDLGDAAVLIGKEITFTVPPRSADAAPVTVTGEVESVIFEDGWIRLKVGEHLVDPSWVASIAN